MAKERGDLLQGTLDMLVLKALQLEAMHGSSPTHARTGPSTFTLALSLSAALLFGGIPVARFGGRASA